MIKSNHGECLINGLGIDILMELNHIFYTVLTDNPELLLAVTTAWASVIETKIVDIDNKLLEQLYKISCEIVENMNDEHKGI